MVRRPVTKARKKPTQRRAQETVRALVEAAARILGREGADALNTNRVAEVAGVSIGSLYQYFPSREALIGAVIDARLEEDAALMREMVEGSGSVRDKVLGAVDLLCDRQSAGADIMPALLRQLGHVEREELARKIVRQVTELLGALLAAEPDALRPDLRDPEALEIALFAIGRSLRWATNEAVVERRELLDDPRFRGELRRIANGLFAANP